MARLQWSGGDGEGAGVSDVCPLWAFSLRSLCETHLRVLGEALLKLLKEGSPVVRFEFWEIPAAEIGRGDQFGRLGTERVQEVVPGVRWI